MTINEIKRNANYIEHHTASRRGYVSRKSEGVIESYTGKFGKGYAVITPRWDSTQYVYVTYYVEKN